MNVDLAESFAQRFGARPRWLVAAAGRVNLLGEHTDYNGGFVLPMAIDRRVQIALAPRDDRRVVLASLDYDETSPLDLDSIAPHAGHWDDYPRGIFHTLEQAGYPMRGWQGVLAGDVPIGAGLSSSAALGVAVAQAALIASGATCDRPQLAQLVQQAENRWVGVQCGIMDPLASACGRAGHALAIDCRSLEIEHVPLPPSLSVVVLDTGTRRQLGGDYNARRRECEAAAAALGVALLRDVSPEDLDSASERLDPIAWRRVRHVVTENARTRAGVEALRAGDASTFGALVDASHAGLRDDFEVSTRELDRIVELARALPGCHGARMTGAGFGGCALALVDSDRVESFAEALAPRYRAETGLEPRLYVCHASDGVTVSKLDD